MNNAKERKHRVRFIAVAAVHSLLVSGCFSEDHLVTDDVTLADAGGGAQGAGGAAADAGGSTPTVTSLGDKTSLGWPIALTPQEVANRLSAFLFKSPPTPRLVQQVVARDPKTNEDVGALADALLIDERSSQGVRGFYRWWLRLDSWWTNREPSGYRPLTAVTQQALLDDALTFAENTTWAAGTFEALLTEPSTYATSATPERWFPTGALPTNRGATHQKVDLPADIYAGILTQPVVVSALHSPMTLPRIKGLLVIDRLLCKELGPHPNIDFGSWPDVSKLGRREAVEAYLAGGSTDPTCLSCHQLMDPMGFTLEHFDWLGAFRSDEDGLPINSEAVVGAPLFDKPTIINGAPALGKALALSPLAWDCFAANWLSYATGAQYRATDVLYSAPRNDIDYILKRATVNGQLNLRGVIRAVTETPAFLKP